MQVRRTYNRMRLCAQTIGLQFGYVAALHMSTVTMFPRQPSGA